MKLLHTCCAIIRHELLIAFRTKTDWLNAWLFFMLMVSLFPLAVTPDAALLHNIAPGLIWIAALFSILLSLNHFLRPDYEDGSLCALVLSPYPLSLLVLSKIVSHWLVSVVPLIVLTPILALLLHLSGWETWSLLGTLLLGTPILTCIGAIGAAVTVGLRNNNVLLSVLIFPLSIPVLVFGTGAVMNVSLGLSNQGIFALLGAFLILAITLTPWAISAALRIGEEG